MAVDFEPMKTVNDYWKNLMPIMACEEMAELIQAISKYERYIERIDEDNYSEEDREAFVHAIVKEMADVSIACAALCNRYEITPGEIGNAIWAKMDKKY